MRSNPPLRYIHLRMEPPRSLSSTNSVRSPELSAAHIDRASSGRSSAIIANFSKHHTTLIL
jgi:hypothetical protein